MVSHNTGETRVEILAELPRALGFVQWHLVCPRSCPGLLFRAQIPHQLTASQGRAQESPEEEGGVARRWAAGLVSVFGLIYEAVPRKDGFNSALEVWLEPHCRPISRAVKRFTGACLGRETLYKLCLCLVVPLPGHSSILMCRAHLGPSSVSVCCCRGEGRERGRRSKQERMMEGSLKKWRKSTAPQRFSVLGFEVRHGPPPEAYVGNKGRLDLWFLTLPGVKLPFEHRTRAVVPIPRKMQATPNSFLLQDLVPAAWLPGSLPALGLAGFS